MCKLQCIKISALHTFSSFATCDQQYYKDLLVVESDPRLARTAQKLALAWRLYNTFAIESAVCRQVCLYIYPT